MSGNRGTEQNVKITYDDYSLRETSLLKTEEKVFLLKTMRKKSRIDRYGY
jgi:hypothetical protein